MISEFAQLAYIILYLSVFSNTSIYLGGIKNMPLDNGKKLLLVLTIY